MSFKAHCPQPWGERVGGVSGEPTRVAGGKEKKFFESQALGFVTVKGTLIHGMPSAFAGGRKSVSLGRSVSSAGGSSQAVARTGDNRCPLEQ